MNRSHFRLGPSCSEGMVLQQGGKAVLWGWSAPGEEHRFQVAGREARTVTDAAGQWTAVWNALPPGGPHPLFHNEVVLFEAVWIGDLWLCAGQSNMERSLEACAVWPEDAQQYRGDPGIRQLVLPNQFDFQAELTDIPGAVWVGADSPEVAKISAVGFHFARQLRARTGIPQGLVLAAVGGSSAQAWLPVEALEAFPHYRREARQYAVPGWLKGVQLAEATRRERWYASLNALDPKDPLRAGQGPWLPVVLPALAKEGLIGDRVGSVWLRKRLELDSAADGSGRLRLGTLVDSDDVWVNGTWVGSTGYQYPSRRYSIPAGVLKPGRNEILIRLVAPRGGLGATPDKVWEMQFSGTSIDLSGPWEWRPGATAEALPADTFLPMVSLGLYNGMLAPLAPLSFRAVLWYQGESNLANGAEYEALMRSLLASWRRLFARPELPFALVQLPLFGEASAFSAQDGWALVRDAQRRLAETDNTALVVTLDAGEWNDIHPGQKHLVGQRLALAVRHLVLEEALDTVSGPLYAACEVGEDGLRLRFTQTGEGLSTREGSACTAFFLAGTDGVFHEAEAQVRPDSVLLRPKQRSRPVEIRYAWASNPAGATLVNSLGIPASPFRALVFPQEPPRG